ncbi:hypothetical protein [Streptomyces sp. A 4/2]|uniref:hypothetical protein n=1 Tax=Streptomyces sp. A 4/2 TaxID=2934314 RepID=UPI0027E4CA76|nr:hypothetical protein [Streptomyces sp. A 4/2]
METRLHRGWEARPRLYARALFSEIATGEEVEDRVRARLRRQQRFLAPGGPLYVAVERSARASSVAAVQRDAWTP